MLLSNKIDVTLTSLLNQYIMKVTGLAKYAKLNCSSDENMCSIYKLDWQKPNFLDYTGNSQQENEISNKIHDIMGQRFCNCAIVEVLNDRQDFTLLL